MVVVADDPPGVSVRENLYVPAIVGLKLALAVFAFTIDTAAGPETRAHEYVDMPLSPGSLLLPSSVTVAPTKADCELPVLAIGSVAVNVPTRATLEITVKPTGNVTVTACPVAGIEGLFVAPKGIPSILAIL
jgi:hypothetical protein